MDLLEFRGHRRAPLRELEPLVDLIRQAVVFVQVLRDENGLVRRVFHLRRYVVLLVDLRNLVVPELRFISFQM